MDLASHRSVVLTRDLVREADVIVTFDDENVATLRRRYRIARAKTYALGDLEATGAQFPDPFGGPVSTFGALYRRITTVLERCVATEARRVPEVHESLSQ